MDTTPAVAFITLGCPKNEADSDRMAGLLASSCRVVPDADDADVLVINTCAFITPAVEEAIDAILDGAAWRAARSGRRLVVAGCLPSRYGDDLVRELPEVDAFVPVADEERIAHVIAALVGQPPPAQTLLDAPRAAPGATAYLKISDGCDRRCSYCTIPAIRGPYRSRTADDIVAEATTLLEREVREIVLVGQDITRWGSDLPDSPRLAGLVRRLAALDGDYRIRMMYVQPDGIHDELLQTMVEHERVCRYLEVPVQHASRSVLRAMGRGGDGEALLSLVDRIRSALPDVVLRTTVMLGFPGETRADVAELAAFLEAARFDYVGVFAFSPEDGTRAASLPDQVPARTRRARAQRIRDLADRIGTAKAAEWVGRTVRVLVEGEEDGLVASRTCGQAPEIDGLTLFSGSSRPGTFVTVRIVDAHGYDLFAEAMT
ncbi:MAG: 30S ribosomal protein S12 methylthiotransferase RimO [Coriobacteriia bacterium]|nr:30S ribosomal protein S12 methylthiotransferase RimO [Coriobacteriia bacterium]